MPTSKRIIKVHSVARDNPKPPPSGKCQVCGQVGQLYRGCCVDCLGELVESYRDERKRIIHSIVEEN